MKGHVTLQSVILTAITILGIIGSVFAWTYSQFMGVTAHASTTDITLAGVVQHVSDIDQNLTTLAQSVSATKSEVDWLVTQRGGNPSNFK